MKKFPKILMFMLLGLFLVCGSAWAIPIGNSLEDVFDSIAIDGDNDIDVYTDYLADNFDSTWMVTASGSSVATMIIELASYADKNVFGVYDNGFYVPIFAGSGVLGDHAVLTIMADGKVEVNFVPVFGVTFTGNSFGFYIDSPDGTFHSDTSLNTYDNYDHMLAYQGIGEMVQIDGYLAGQWTDNEYILAFEDLFGGGDQDFDDLVVMVESVNPNPVPEPATMLLLGVGLIGIAGVGRKRFLKKP